MEIKNIDGNLLDSTAEYIVHQVNCLGVMGSGVALAIRNKWPVVCEEYEKLFKNSDEWSRELLGRIQIVKVNEVQSVVNLFGQASCGYGERFTSYDAVDDALRKLSKNCKENGIKSIALPYRMSSDRGGANWNIILEMVKQHFNDLDITVEIWKL